MKSSPPFDDVLSYFEFWEAQQPETVFNAFLGTDGHPRDIHTYRSLGVRSRLLANVLHRTHHVLPGDRVLLVYSPGLEVIVAFFACVLLGALPVPLPPPKSASSRDFVRRVAVDSQATLMLTDISGQRADRTVFDEQNPSCLSVVTSEINETVSQNSCPTSEAPPRGGRLFIQYTSGSTGAPKGVLVSHENVIHNCLATIDHKPIGVTWLPHFHDMGLIGYSLFVAITGGSSYALAPHDFLRTPRRWFEAITRYRATMSSAPNFGYQYCISEKHLPESRLANIDLSSLRLLMNGSEAVNPETFQKFHAQYSPYGLRPGVHVVAYGLAENTLAVSIGTNGKRTTVDTGALRKGQVAVLPDGSAGTTLMSCGAPLKGVHTRIVDPESRLECKPDRVGEIWIRGRSTCEGYWNQPQATADAFAGKIASGDGRSYLRTGDLGFVKDNELYVCGRLKSIIICRGENYHAEDLERAVADHLSPARGESVVAFEDLDRPGHLVVLIGGRATSNMPSMEHLALAIRTCGYPGPLSLLLVRPSAIVRTTSGKLARQENARRFSAAAFRPIALHQEAPVSPAVEESLTNYYSRVLKNNGLVGDETETLSMAGLDSLQLVNLGRALEFAIHQTHDAQIQSVEVDASLLQDLQVNQVTNLVRLLSSGADLDAFRGLLRDYRQSRRQGEGCFMQADAVLPPPSDLSIRAAQGRFGHVLLTGGTGFFGPFLLTSLLKRSAARFTVLVRASHQALAMKRLEESLTMAGVYDEQIREDFQNRVQVIAGDLAKPDLGMTRQMWSHLASEVDTIVHNGAFVDYMRSYATLRAPNVLGTRDILRLALTSSRKEVHVVSSTTIFGWSTKKELLESDTNAEMAGLDFGYAQSKWVAEQLASSARGYGVDVRIYRPAFLTPAANGVGSRDDVVIRLLAFMIKHELAPETLNQVSFLPVDVAAEDAAQLMLLPTESQNSTFHLTADGYYNLTDIARAIESQYRIAFRYVPLNDFVRILRVSCTPAEPIYPLLDFIVRAHVRFSAMQDKRYSNTRSRAALLRAEVTRQRPTMVETVNYLLSYMRQANLVALKPRASGLPTMYSRETSRGTEQKGA